MLSQVAHAERPGLRGAMSKTLSVFDQTLQYLHFKIDFTPIQTDSTLTDLFYSIQYKEYGSNQEFPWVALGDGHLINLPGQRKQIEGPFYGAREIKYKFRFEIIHSGGKAEQDSLRIHIYSTNPARDAAYVDSYYKAPFKVIATFFDGNGIKRATDSYSLVSTLVGVVKVLRGGSVVTFVVTFALETAATFLVGRLLDDYASKKPVEFAITCNACNAQFNLSRLERAGFAFKCKTSGCGNRGNIDWIQ